MDKLILEARKYIDQGIYDQHVLFELLNSTNNKHYSTIRTAVHLAKVRAY